MTQQIYFFLYIQKKWKHMSTNAYNSPTMEIIQMLIDEYVNKHAFIHWYIAYPHNRIMYGYML